MVRIKAYDIDYHYSDKVCWRNPEETTRNRDMTPKNMYVDGAEKTDLHAEEANNDGSQRLKY